MEETVSDSFVIADTFNTNFVTIVPNMKIHPKETSEIGTDEINVSIFKALIKFKYHPSIKIIKSKKISSFSFEAISYKEILKEFKK